MNIFRFLLVFQLLVAFTGSKSHAQDLPPRPDPPRLVNDLAGFFNPGQADQMEKTLVDFSQRTSTQIAVVTVPDLQGFAISDYAVRLGDKWGIGQKGVNNGVIILIKPRNEEGKGEVTVSTGYGMEAVLPDATAKRIIDEVLIPGFKQGKNYEAVETAAGIIMKLSLGEFPEKDFGKFGSDDGKLGFLVLGLPILFLLLFFFKANRMRKNHLGGTGLPFWIALNLLSGLGGRSSGGGFSDFSSGGGGFGGFGGGSFGGGGASGSW